jgi:UDP-GlcNAc:undecaprenyl-phosphate/decaprenyl-phosphate GlcNAc-1-phosphate transferase
LFHLIFPLTIYIAAFASALLATLLASPLWRKECLRTGLVDDPGHRKIHTTPIPLSGGLAVMTGLAVPVIFAAAFVFYISPESNSFALIRPKLEKRAIEFGAIFLGAIGMLLLGWIDDKHELSPKTKFAGQFFIALLVAAAGVRITLFVPNIFFSYAITILWILTVTNAFNFIDNMNGLCAGIGFIGAWYFALSAMASGQILDAVVAFVIAGSLLGFLPYNFPKASAFLGDAGSHVVGFLLAVLAILPHFYTPDNQKSFAVLRPLLILAVPLADLVWVVILRWRMGKPFYIGDTNHFSHQLTRRGLSPARAVIFIWLVAALAGSLALL